MADVVGFDAPTVLDLSAEKVLNAALTAGMDHAIIIGWSEGDSDPYHASTTADIPEMLFRIEMFKRELLERAAS